MQIVGFLIILLLYQMKFSASRISFVLYFKLMKLRICIILFRCIKPNHSKLPDNFEVKVVADQLRSTGVLETTRIRKLGFSTRLSFQMFLLRYTIFCLSLGITACAGENQQFWFPTRFNTNQPVQSQKIESLNFR